MPLTDIATYFSTGQFSRIQQHFSQTITWEIVGEQQLSGFDQVLKHLDLDINAVHLLSLPRLLEQLPPLLVRVDMGFRWY